MKNNAKTFDAQTARFLAEIATCIPSEINSDVMQKWIENPSDLKKALKSVLFPEVDGVIAAKQQLQKYFQEVFGVKLNLSKMKFPEKDGFDGYMVVPPNLDEDTIMDAFVKKWGIKTYKYLSPVAEKIDRDKEQPRPSGLYVFAHKGGDEPDEIHRGKSYNQAKSEDMTFASTKEYLLITGFHKYTKKYFMDKKGWTRTSSLWSDDYLVCGYWNEAGGKLYLSYGFPGNGSPDHGLRELVLG